MKRLALHLLAGVFAPAVVWSATITWNAPCPITAESDVVNTGTTMYAYSCYVWGGTYKINDVYFTPWGSHPNDDKVQFGIDADLQGAAASQKVAEGITNSAAGVTWAYYNTLSQVAASEKAGSTMTLRLKRLVPGRRYLVQFWCNTSGDVDYTNQVTPYSTPTSCSDECETSMETSVSPKQRKPSTPDAECTEAVTRTLAAWLRRKPTWRTGQVTICAGSKWILS